MYNQKLKKIMSEINLSVHITVDLSDQTREFMTKLFKGTSCHCTETKKKAEQPKPVASTPAQTIEDVEAELKREHEEQLEAEAAERKAETSDVTLEQLRKVMTAKVNDHRGTIKAKLTEYDAKSLSTLDESHYAEFYNFLLSL